MTIKANETTVRPEVIGFCGLSCGGDLHPLVSGDAWEADKCLRCGGSWWHQVPRHPGEIAAAEAAEKKRRGPAPAARTPGTTSQRLTINGAEVIGATVEHDASGNLKRATVDAADVPPVVLAALAGRAADATLPAGTAPKSFPMPGSVWRFRGDNVAPATGPLVVVSLRWIAGHAEAVFEGSCAGVSHMMGLDAWEMVEGAPMRAVPVVADVENDGDRGPRVASPLTDARRCDKAIGRLTAGERAIAAWILEALPTLEARCRAITLEGVEPAYQADGRTPTPNTFTATPREHVALAGLLSTVRDVQRVIDPYHGQEVDPRAVKGGAT